ncbi:MAG: cytochrome c oxidase subunit I [Actinomycetota bacterium]|nr:cytochrome c oxidase subunit I [Actinomycetota bacterium]
MATDTARLAQRLDLVWGERPGFRTWVSTVDHKRIGNRYLYTGMLFFVLGGIQSLLMRLQLMGPNLDVLGPEAYNQMFSMHGITMMFLFATPVLSAFGNFFVPLMIGTRDMAFPRLNAFGYWVFLGAGIFMYSAFLIGAAPNDGWFNYPPLASNEFTPGVNIDYYALGLIFVGISTTGGAINFLVTIMKMRAPGMTLNRIPIFVWGEVAFSLQVIFALPLLTLANVLLELERKFGFHFFNPEGGGDPILWQHLFWLFGHPEVYIVVLPAFGIVSAIIPTWARRRMIGYTYIVLAELAVAVIGFGVWVHHMFATGIPSLSLSFISAASFMVAIPSGVQVFAWIATLIAGRPILRTPMLFVLGFIITFVIGGVTGVMFSSVPFDQATTDSMFVVAHLHYVLVGGAVFPIFAGLYHWLPKMTGRMLDERLGKWSFWLIFIGFNLNMFPLHLTGLWGQPRRIYTYHAGLGWDFPNLLSTIGAFTMALGVLLTLWNWARSLRRGEPAGPNPWDGETLEWATASPPRSYNFETIPTVKSREPLWDQPELKDGAAPPDEGGWPLASGHVTLATTVVEASPQAIVEMPHASPWPFLLTLALMVLFFGLLVDSWVLSAAGIILSTVGILGWFAPHSEEEH